jgi:feruloyl esterase
MCVWLLLTTYDYLKFWSGISYEDLDYGSTLHFATIASNNGHDGRTGLPFLGKPEVINDFAHRAIHVEVILGKQIVEAYYGRPHAKSYYMGCSTGGRQGAQSALRYPADFDGILAGSPAIDFNHMMYWVGMLGKAVGAPLGDASPSFISPALWEVVAAEVISQCDALDGVRNGIIDEPDACDFRPEALMCGGDEEDSSTCLTVPQIDALRKIYSPLYADGELKYPRFDPGAEGSPAIPLTFSGDFPGSTRVRSLLSPAIAAAHTSSHAGLAQIRHSQRHGLRFAPVRA